MSRTVVTVLVAAVLAACASAIWVPRRSYFRGRSGSARGVRTVEEFAALPLEPGGAWNDPDYIEYMWIWHPIPVYRGTYGGASDTQVLYGIALIHWPLYLAPPAVILLLGGGLLTVVVRRERRRTAAA